MSDLEPDVTEILAQWSAGDESARERLIPIVYDELRRLAGGFLRRERDGHTLQPTALVHEAFLRFFRQRNVPTAGSAHFYGLLAQLMRRVLVDHARRKGAEKRGGGELAVTFQDDLVQDGRSELEILDVDRAMTRLEALDRRQAKIVEMRVFAGLGVPETAAALGISPSTVKREWRIARAWLRRELQHRV